MSAPENRQISCEGLQIKQVGVVFRASLSLAPCSPRVLPIYPFAYVLLFTAASRWRWMLARRRAYQIANP